VVLGVDTPQGVQRLRAQWVIDGEGSLAANVGAGFVRESFDDRFLVADVPARVLGVGRDLRDTDGVLAGRYDARPGTVILIRPDGHVAARWRRWDEALIETAIRRCLCL
jgi:3-(3-hydroxy-phenyl)propionate hydroxylase